MIGAPLAQRSDLIVLDQTSNHEVSPSGVPGGYSWKFAPVLVQGCNPDWSGVGDWTGPYTPEWRAILPWFTAYLGSTGHTAVNTGVEIASLEIQYFSRKDRRWKKLQIAQPNPGSFGGFTEDLTGSQASPWYNVPASGGLELAPGGGYCLHGWTSRIPTPWNDKIHDLGALCVAVKHRLCLINKGGTDDRALASIVVQAGCDYWPTLTTTMTDILPATVLPGAGLGRFLKSRNDYRLSTFWCVHPSLGAAEVLKEGPLGFSL